MIKNKRIQKIYKIIFTMIVVIAFLVSMYTPVSAMQGETAKAGLASISVNAEVNERPGIATIWGKISTGSGKMIAVTVITPSNAIGYLDQIISGQNGEYSVSFKLDSDENGEYKVKVNGYGIAEPAETAFRYGKNSTGGKDDTNVPSVNPKDDNVIIDSKLPKATVKATLKTGKSAAEASISSDLLKKLYDKAQKDSNGKQKIMLEISDVKSVNGYTVEFSAADLTGTANANKQIDVITPAGNIMMPCNMFQASQLSNAKKIEITVSTADKSEIDESLNKEIGNKPVVELTASVDGKPIRWGNPDAPVTVAVKYTPSESELKNPEHIVVWYIDGLGKVNSVPSGKYNANTGMVTFTTTHFSTFAVAYVNKTFSDIATYKWAENPIEVLASKGIVSGTSDSAYCPAADITRAEFIVCLVKALNLDAKIDSNFADVKSGCYYYQSAGIAKKLGIINGVGKNMFVPNKVISRQDMMVIVAKALQVTKNEAIDGSAQDLKEYKDTDKIASYAVTSVATLVKKNIIQGSNISIDPKGNVSRAQAAVVVYKLYNMYN